MVWNWNNISSIHHRWMMRYLEKRGWVVFYLEPKYRFCVDANGAKGCGSNCWLSLYETSKLIKEIR